MEDPKRSAQQIKEHYQLEKQLASRLRAANTEQRKKLYNEVYDELLTTIKHHPTLRNNKHPDELLKSTKYKLQTLAPFLKADSHFLEVGPGDCALCLEVSKCVDKVYAADVTEAATQGISFPENFKLVISDGTSIPVPEGSIDVAFSNQLMEHLHPEDATDQLKNIFKALKIGGVYICTTPNRLNGPHDISSHFDSVATGLHLKEYTVTELAELFKQVGFSKVESYVRFRGKTHFLPPSLAINLERFIGLLPKKTGSRIAHTPIARAVLGIKVVAFKSSY